MIHTKNKKNIKKTYPEPIEGVDYTIEMKMDMKELLNKLPKFKESDIKYLISKRVIRCFPIKALDYEILKRLHNIWGTGSMVKVNIKHLKPPHRILILDQVNKGIDTKIEAWIYTKINNLLNKGIKRIPRRNIETEIISRFKLKNSKQKRNELRKIIDRIIRKIAKENSKKGNLLKKE